MVFKRTHVWFYWLIIAIGLVFGLTQSFFAVPGEGKSQVVINEFLAENASGLADEDGDYSDWIELYNRSRRPVNLAGWSLTDDPAQPDKWVLPDVTLDGGQYLVVFASGKDRKSSASDLMLHTNFRLVKEGEYLALYNPTSRKFLDVVSLEYSEQFGDVSYGRLDDEPVYGYMATPTPGGPNDETLVWKGVVPPVDFNVGRGFYDEPFTLELSTPLPDAVIHYTTDGSQPTETRGTLYTEPIVIDATTAVRAVALKPDFLSPHVTTNTYLFLDSILAQPVVPRGFPSTWGTYANGDPVVADYEMDPQVVNDPRYHNLMRDALTSIPSLSLVTDVENLDIYSNTEGRGEAWERPVSVELIYPPGERTGFQQDAGLRIQGGVGRTSYIPKHSFRLFFKNEYGATKLEYPIFPDSPVERFDTLVLRAGMNRSYAGKKREPRVDIRLTTYTRDEWLRRSQIEMSGLGSHGIFVHLYLNGLYWGLYNLVERPDASFTSSYLGGRKEDWFAVNHSGPVSGSAERFQTLQELASAGGLEDPGEYAAIKEYIDIAQFIDYIILNTFAGNEDWALTNWYAGMQSEDGQIKYFVWDGELIWIEGANIASAGPDAPVIWVEVFFNALMQNPDFKMEFADRMYKHLYHDGALTDANSQARWAEINEPIELAILGESARWGDVRYEPPITQEHWLVAYEDVLTQMEGNVDKWIALARRFGYYPLIDPPEFNQHGGLVTTGFELTMAAPEGSIYYTTDGSDPRLAVTGEIAPTSVEYCSPVVLTATTQVKARVLSNGVWSALHEATFRVREYDSPLRVTEIMYNPIGGDDFEFIELKNTADIEIDLSNMSLGGIDFSFPTGTTLPAGEFFVLARDSAAFAQRYPDVSIGGTYQRKLSNGGEELVLEDAQGKVLISIPYDDENGWPVSPDGRGDSLVLVNWDGDPQDPKNWRASASLNGSPGADDPVSQ